MACRTQHDTRGRGVPLAVPAVRDRATSRECAVKRSQLLKRGRARARVRMCVCVRGCVRGGRHVVRGARRPAGMSYGRRPLPSPFPPLGTTWPTRSPHKAGIRGRRGWQRGSRESPRKIHGGGELLNRLQLNHMEDNTKFICHFNLFFLNSYGPLWSILFLGCFSY